MQKLEQAAGDFPAKGASNGKEYLILTQSPFKSLDIYVCSHYVKKLTPLIFRMQICANLDSAIVSAEVHAPELAAKVPRPRTTFDIVEKRPEVSSAFAVSIEYHLNVIYAGVEESTHLFVCPQPIGSVCRSFNLYDAEDP